MSQTAKALCQLFCLVGGLYCMHDENLVGGLLALYGIVITHLFKGQPKQKRLNPEWKTFIIEIEKERD